MRDDLTDDELERYARHVILEEVGEEGQIKLLESKVLVVGAGGLGAPVLMYLAAAGIGTLGIVDHDVVDLSNLQRQIIHSVDDIGRPKTRSAAERLETINPDITIIEHRTRLTASNAADLFADYDLIVDGSDNFAARYLCNDTSYSLKKPLVSAALVRFEGQLSTFKAYDGGPCYRCLFPEPPDPDLVPRCDTVGIFGAVAGVMGSLQATEVLKELLGLGTSMAGQLLLFDALDQTFRKIKVPKDPDCPTCGN
ncbi:MAG TPA: adenylyltransferase [Rhodospirillaceae bacterium]|nr:adenylyltransferase [Rhodospirillaceae bacterium]MAX63972.1 adenylyltransferase [Rhodospirillaceae bacterium]MBB58906.1 adenylyltransferase [Rhodospirillaceae bacterium]HAJ19619.1 adenylyltransferase [Rhodospirillaceae bacterium]HBM11694.1 adenylyltransferase [Rhodospirillaceae bacterium]|tara:strand:- start:75299 stop:76057 length:759 start_codon:yes stop_codon:yes gene_type:complete